MNQARRIETAVVTALLAAALVLALLIPDGVTASLPTSDLANQFAPWRAFAAASLKAGHFPLWNPYTYAGEPFFGGFQSAMLYPLNAVFLVLPLTRALDLSFFLHLVILGWGMHRWARQRGLHPAAAVLCGLALPLSGPVWPHLYAGHLSNLCTMAWIPWALAGLERWWAERRPSGLFAASGAVALGILAGHMQYVYFAGVAAGLQALAWSASEPVVRRRALPAVAAAFGAAALLTAVQLLPGFAAASESVRQGRLPFVVASSLFLPVENLLTLFAPGFFGDFLHTIYWGRWYMHEASVFVGPAALALAAAAVSEPGRRRVAARDLALAALLLLLALGSETPLYRLLYDYAPGIAQFRGMSKFTFPAVLFLLLAAGAGIDGLIRRPPARRTAAGFALAMGLAAGAAALWLRAEPGLIPSWSESIRRTGELFLPAGLPATVFQGIGAQAQKALFGAAGSFLVVGAALAASRRWPALRWAPVGLFALEAVAFAAGNTATGSLALGVPDPLREFIRAHPGDYRILNAISPRSGSDSGFLLGAPDIWGNDPMVLRRYAEFITASQGYDAAQASQDIAGFRWVQPVYAMLRLGYVVTSPADLSSIQVHAGPPNPMARVQLIPDYRVVPGRQAQFDVMKREDFDPRRLVLLESEPEPRPVPSDHPGTARVVADSTDALTIEADAVSPSLLVITDLYSKDWRAAPLPGSSQRRYDVLPADYILRAIPLAAGHHLLRVEYAPPSLRIGLAISALAALGWLGAAVVLARRSR